MVSWRSRLETSPLLLVSVMLETRASAVYPEDGLFPSASSPMKMLTRVPLFRALRNFFCSAELSLSVKTVMLIVPPLTLAIYFC